MYICHRIGEMAEWSNAAVLKTVEGHTSGGSNPSFSAYIPRELNVFGVLFFWWSVRWSASPFLALKDVTDPSDLTMLWIMQKPLDCFYRSIAISIMPGICPRGRPQLLHCEQFLLQTQSHTFPKGYLASACDLNLVYVLQHLIQEQLHR